MSELGLRSELLAQKNVVHGFSIRSGGVSEGAHASLNFGHSTGDDPKKVQQNLELFLAWLPTPKPLFSIHQVHGTEVVNVDENLSPAAARETQADALVSQGIGALGIRTADCVPVLFFEHTTQVYAAAHAGWRGVLGGVACHVVAQLAREPRTSANVIAAIGPCIEVCCFEVGEEVALEFENLAPWAVVRKPEWQKPHVDLRRALRTQLQALWVPDAQIEDVGGCTHCHPELYFSHRREPNGGRMLSVIAGCAQ
jgi:hypothetical protein